MQQQKKSEIVLDKWSSIWSLALGVSGIMIGEFLPAGVLTPMALDLKISEGVAGQAVTATSIIAVIASLLISFLTRKCDRKKVLLSLMISLIFSNLIVAFAPNFSVLLIGRVLLGITLGGFWSMAAAISIRLVSSENIPKALSIIFGAASFSAMLAAPLGSFLGNIIGWRNVFIISSFVGVIGFVWQVLSLPKLNPIGEVKLSTLLDVVKIPNFKIGLIAIGLAFCGRFATITYLRPFLEQDVKATPGQVTAIFFIFDLAYFLGTLFAGKLVEKNLNKSLYVPPVFLALSSLALIFFHSNIFGTVFLIFMLGISFAPLPVSWSTWTAKSAPENTETGGGLYVASIQLSAAFGALFGGFIFDHIGSKGVFLLSACSWTISSLIVLLLMQVHVRRVTIN